jgi:hypothetical protein
MHAAARRIITRNRLRLVAFECTYNPRSYFGTEGDCDFVILPENGPGRSLLVPDPMLDIFLGDVKNERGENERSCDTLRNLHRELTQTSMLATKRNMAILNGEKMTRTTRGASLNSELPITSSLP